MDYVVVPKDELDYLIELGYKGRVPFTSANKAYDEVVGNIRLALEETDEFKIVERYKIKPSHFDSEWLAYSEDGSEGSEHEVEVPKELVGSDTRTKVQDSDNRPDGEEFEEGTLFVDDEGVDWVYVGGSWRGPNSLDYYNKQQSTMRSEVFTPDSEITMKSENISPVGYTTQAEGDVEPGTHYAERDKDAARMEATFPELRTHKGE